MKISQLPSGKPCYRARQVAGMLSLISMLLVLHVWCEPKFVWAKESGDRLSVRYLNGRLSICAKNAQLGDVLQEISNQTGITIESGFALEESISVEFTDRPLEAGLTTLLKNKNHSFFYLEDLKKDQRPILSHLSLVGQAGWQGYATKLADKEDLAKDGPSVPIPVKQWEEVGRQIESFLGQREHLELLSNLGEVQLPGVPEGKLKQLEQALDSRRGDVSRLEELVKKLPQASSAKTPSPSR